MVLGFSFTANKEPPAGLSIHYNEGPFNTDTKLGIGFAAENLYGEDLFELLNAKIAPLLNELVSEIKMRETKHALLHTHYWTHEGLVKRIQKQANWLDRFSLEERSDIKSKCRVLPITVDETLYFLFDESDGCWPQCKHGEV